MRTVEQVVNDLTKARQEEEITKNVRVKYESELRAIYDAAEKALGLPKQPVYRGDTSLGGDGRY